MTKKGIRGKYEIIDCNQLCELSASISAASALKLPSNAEIAERDAEITEKKFK